MSLFPFEIGKLYRKCPIESGIRIRLEAINLFLKRLFSWSLLKYARYYHCSESILNGTLLKSPDKTHKTPV